MEQERRTKQMAKLGTGTIAHTKHQYKPRAKHIVKVTERVNKPSTATNAQTCQSEHHGERGGHQQKRFGFRGHEQNTTGDLRENGNNEKDEKQTAKKQTTRRDKTRAGTLTPNFSSHLHDSMTGAQYTSMVVLPSSPKST